jgi:deazaflavin-dependent oxidoreductase (nitroreductase family)
MWFMNKIANPFVKLILRSPLHGWISAVLLLITYRGRKSGKEFTLPVQYVQDRNHVYIVPGFAEKKVWWRNLKGGMNVKLMLKGKSLNGVGILLDQNSDSETIVKAVGLYLQQFPSLAKTYNIRSEADGKLNDDDIRKVSVTVTMIQVKLNEGK